MRAKLLAAAITVVSTVLLAAPSAASASPATPSAVPAQMAVAEITKVQLPKKQITATEFLARSGARSGTGAQSQVKAFERCWTWALGVEGLNVYDQTLFRYLHTIDWCDDGIYITRTTEPRITGEVFWPLWQFNGVKQQSSSFGAGTPKWISHSQGQFCYQLPEWGCVQQANPWLEARVFADGTYEHSWGA